MPEFRVDPMGIYNPEAPCAPACLRGVAGTTSLYLGPDLIVITATIVSINWYLLLLVLTVQRAGVT